MASTSVGAHFRAYLPLSVVAMLVFAFVPTTGPRNVCHAADTTCIDAFVVQHRHALEEARARGGPSLVERLTKLGLNSPAARNRAADVLEELPRYDVETGAPLNAAAKALLEEDLAAKHRSATDSSSAPAGIIPAVRIARGTWKYVLIQADDAVGDSALYVRSTAGLQYHAEMAEDAIRSELHRLQNVRVLGGGRLAFDGRTVSIWGYSKTYGRCEACNERAAALIRSSPAHAQYRVTWTNDGY